MYGIRARVVTNCPKLLMSAALAFVLAVAVAPPSSAQSEATAMSIDQVIVEDGGEKLTAVVSVLDADGGPVAGLTDFHASINGVPTGIEAVTGAVDQDVGVSVVLLIDVSGSMQGKPLARAQDAAVAFVQQLLPADRVAMLSFGSEVASQVAFADDVGLAIRRVRELGPDMQDGTALHDAVLSGVALAEDAPTRRQVMLMLTDGRNTGDASVATRDEALAAVARAGVPVYSIALGEEADVGFLSALAQASSGAVSEAPDPGDLPGIFDAIGAQLRGQYLIQIDIPQTSDSPNTLAVEIGGLRAQAPLAVSSARGPSSSAAPLFALAAGGILLAAVVGGFAVWLLVRRRRRRSPIRGGPGVVQPSSSASGRLASTKPQRGVLEIIDGPETGSRVAVGESPVLLGSAPGCDLRLNGGAAGEHARAWMRGGRLVVHHLAFGHRTVVDGSPIEWANLAHGDRFRVGQDTLEFVLEEPNQSGVSRDTGSFLS